MSKIDMCPIIASDCCLTPDESAGSSTSIIARRVAPVESSAPQQTRLSSMPLFSADASTRSQKSQIEVKCDCSRAATIARTAPSPTRLTAVRPKRIRPSTTAKSDWLELTSGGSTSMPIASHSAT